MYRKCLPLYDFSTDTYFDAIEEMLIPGAIMMVGELNYTLFSR